MMRVWNGWMDGSNFGDAYGGQNRNFLFFPLGSGRSKKMRKLVIGSQIDTKNRFKDVAHCRVAPMKGVNMQK